MAYNLLVTSDWMLIAPRRAESYHDISVNALGFAGSLLVRNIPQLDLIRSIGPLALLSHVGVPR
jgi:ATP adenylyltransferase